MKRIMNLVMLFMLLFIGQNAWCQDETTLTEIESGSLSSTVQWTVSYKGYDEWDMHLSITGTGAMPDFTSIYNTPWYSYYQYISSVSISSGITAIGAYAFEKLGMDYVDIPLSVTSIGKGAFSGSSLLDIHIPSSVTSIGKGAFDNCKQLNFIHYRGRCTANTGIAFSGVAAKGFFFEEERSGTVYAQVPSGWEYHTHNGSLSTIVPYIYNGTLYIRGRGEYSIHSSSAGWYSKRNDITKIVVAEGITNIGARSFEGCDKVTEVTLNNKGIIDYGAFNDCSSLSRVNIGIGVTGLVEKYYLGINFYPFRGCSKLTTINISDFASFNAISNLNLLTDSNYGTTEEKLLLVNGLTPNQNITNGLTEIKSEAIRYFKNVTKLNIPSTVADIPQSHFHDCKYLTEVTLNNNGNIGRCAFENCANVTEVTLNNKGYIGSSAFENCTNLTEVTLNNKGTIDASAFKNCTSLTRVNIGTGLTEFISVLSNIFYPFYGCSKLTTINVSDFASFYAIKNLSYLTSSNYGTADEKTLFINGTPFSSTSELEIPEGVTYVNAEAIKYFSNVTKIKIPSSVKEIRGANFSKCKYLTEIIVPSTVNNVGDFAFRDCTGLRTVALKNKGDIGEGAFEGCTSLQIVSLNNIGSFIGNGVFYKCSSLTRVNVGAGFKGFEDITTSSYYTYDKYYPFEGCSKLKNINIVDFASFNAIKNLNYLTSSNYGTAEEKTLLINGTAHNANNIFYIPEGITYNVHALRFFSNVKKVCFPSTTTKIANLYFQYATDIILPVSVTSVAEGAFYNCPALERIVCLCPERAPSTTGSVAVNPSKITLRVPYTSSATFAASEVWREFKIEEGPLSYKTCYMKTLEERDVDAYISGKIVFVMSSNPDVVTLENGVLSSCDYKYKGDTTTPETGSSIIAVTENADSYLLTVFVEPREVELTDGDAYKLVEDFDAEKITYTRTYAEKYANHFQCFYIPFDVEVTDELLEDYTFYRLYMISQKDENGNGEIEDNEPLVMLLNKIPAGQVMHANMPYYIKPKAASTLTVTAKNTTLHAAEKVTVSCSTMQKEYSLTGVYEPTNIKGYYTMSAKGNFSYYTKDTNLGSYRWYMSVRDRMARGEEHEDYARPIEILIDGEDETTGIVALEDKASAKQNDKIYTLDGRQVTDFETLPSGIYIVNGKKMYKK